jgi:hypothetical protein
MQQKTKVAALQVELDVLYAERVNQAKVKESVRAEVSWRPSVGGCIVAAVWVAPGT